MFCVTKEAFSRDCERGRSLAVLAPFLILMTGWETTGCYDKDQLCVLRQKRREDLAGLDRACVSVCPLSLAQPEKSRGFSKGQTVFTQSQLMQFKLKLKWAFAFIKGVFRLTRLISGIFILSKQKFDKFVQI